MAMIEVEDLRKNYGSFRALLGISFEVDRGEILGFLGPNGAGKTTTMKILTGSLNPSSGRATVGGHDVLEDAVSVRRVLGYLPENTPLYEDMSVREYLGYCGRLRGMRGRNLAERIWLLGSDGQLDDRVSAAMLQRALALGKAGAQAPSMRVEQAVSVFEDSGKPCPCNCLELRPDCLPKGGLSLEALERRVIVASLQMHRGNKTAAARYLEIPRHVLVYRMKKFEIDRTTGAPS